ncbi:hypothetical protein EHM69_07910 [candidate division KSB1 bacterium]|nr:MAG: hypothetical protein EHM69_07910 [candidate division KSB1 bacterium]
MKRLALFVILVCWSPAAVLAASVLPDSGRVIATRINTPPKIDGIPDEAIWGLGVIVSHFTQKNPDELTPPTQKTEVVVLYDDDALYVCARLHDTAPDSIHARLVRRDVDVETDVFTVNLDPYHDHRSGNYFAVNAAGTCLDGVRYNDTWGDGSWDGVWEGAAARFNGGWTAEFRIPFSQLRFADANPMIWGVNFKRYIARRNEEDLLNFAPRKESGFVSRFWHLEGLENLKRPHYFEVLPYVRGKAAYSKAEDGDPFHDGSEYTPAAGADFKLGLGPNLVLNATVNPDFGQVEVDPAVVNLSDVETYFQEKRPFFLEGATTFEFGYGGATNYWSSNWPAPTHFYSRRIGRTPQGDLPDNDFAKEPEGAHILGAGKITGKLKGDWNIGSLHAVTMREHAKIQYEGRESEVEVEPFTYYSVTRAQKEIRNGFRGLGGIFTTAHRFFDEQELKDQINSDAFMGGADGWSFLDSNRTYVLTGWLGASHVRGNSERMIELQRSSRHYFQRPDASHVEVDSNAASLSGWAGRLMLNKEKGPWMLNTAVGVISPGFENNDLGYMSRADVVNTHFGGGYRWTDPTKWTRYADLSAMSWTNYDFMGNNTALGLWYGTYLQFLNYWSLNLAGDLIPQTINNTRTRGGPLTLNRAGWEASVSVNTDSRKPVVLGAGTSRFIVASDHWTHSVWSSVEWKPADNFSLSLSPGLDLSRLWVQWVDVFDDPTAVNTYGKRYVFSAMNETDLYASFRINYTLTPKLSLQLYAQPYFSSADYSDFRELSKPRSFDFYTYPGSDVQFDESSNQYTIDPDGDGPAETFTFDNPDFDYRSLRGNIILRWEYRPGSTFYFVWTHGRSDDEDRGRFDWNRSCDRLFRADSDNIFLIKATFWLNV